MLTTLIVEAFFKRYKTEMKLQTYFIAFAATALLLVASSQTFASNYCAAIRGNGEAVPAHWGALAKIVENRGMPERVAGGSSATITMMFLDAISRNQQISQDESKRKIEQALLIKSFMAHLNYLWEEDSKAPKVMGLVADFKNAKFLNKLTQALKLAKSTKDFFHLLGDYGAILNPALVQELHRDFSFGKTQLQEAVMKLGKFDAKNDLALFYREGLVDFKFIALMLGKVADYYAGNTDQQTLLAQQSFIQQCALKTQNIWWDDFAAHAPECLNLFKQSLDHYYSQKSFQNKMIFEKLGSGLSAIATTSIVKGEAINRYFKMRQLYQKQRGINVEDYSLDFDRELSYGYWGDHTLLSNTKETLVRDFADDLKSQKFLNLGSGTWFEVLSTSPAEPGLSNLQRIPDSQRFNRHSILEKDYFKKVLGVFPTSRALQWFDEVNPKNGILPFRPNMLSAGGWSDLHPTIVLKASGCQDVLFVTRQGGDSVFGQQIFIRLTGATKQIPFWKEIRQNNRQGWMNLSIDAEATAWNRIYNLGNPDSSYSRSIKTAQAIFCTNWDGHDLFSGELKSLQRDAWEAPIFINNDAHSGDYDFGGESEGKSEDQFPGCIPKF